MSDHAGDDPTPRAGEGGGYRKTPSQLATDPAFTATYAKISALLKRAPGISGLPVVMSSPPATARGVANAASAISSSVTYTLDIPGQFRILGTVARRVAAGFAVWDAQPYANTSSPPWAVETVLDTADATGRFEILLRGNGGNCRVAVWQNARWEYITRGYTFSVPSDGNSYRGLVTLGSAGVYTLRVEMTGSCQFGGISAGPTDTLSATPPRPVRAIVIGDSFTEPTIMDTAPYPVSGATGQATGDTITLSGHNLTAGTKLNFITLTGGAGLSTATNYFVINPTSTTFQVATTDAGAASDITTDYSAITYSVNAVQMDGYTMQLAHMTGWDVWASGSGGTGYINPGSGGRTTFRGRLAADILAYSPDVIIWAGGINDYSYAGYSYSVIFNEALACYQQAKTALPNVVQLVLSGWWPKDITSTPGTFVQLNDGLKAAAARVNGTTYVSMNPVPLTSPALSATYSAGTLQAQANAAATSISSDVSMAVGTYIRIGAVGSATQEFRKITGLTGSGPYTLTFSGTGGGGGLGSTHSAGEPITPVGRNIYTGTGSQAGGAGPGPKNDGNADRDTGNDGTHPTIPGHKNIAISTTRECITALS